MQTLPRQLVAAKFISNSQTTQYTANNVYAVISACTITNNSASAATFSLNLVPSGGSAQASNRLVDEISIAAGRSYRVPELVGHVVPPSSSISAIASAADALTIVVSGIETSG